jgi:hypothetical protein
MEMHLSLLYIATHMPFAHTFVKNRYRIFLMPVHSKKNFNLGNIAEPGFGILAKMTGCRDRPYRNFTTAVTEGKTRGHVCSKTQRHVLSGYCSGVSSLVLRAFTEAYRCVKFIFSLDLLVLLHRGKRTRK